MKRMLATIALLPLLLSISAHAQTASAAATPPTPVKIANFLSTPGHVSDVNKPAHTPFSKRLDINISGGTGSLGFTVPAGKVLVITYVSSQAQTPVGGSTLFDLATVYAGGEVESHFPESNQGVLLGVQLFASSERTTIYADPGSTVTASFLASSNSAGGAVVGIYGYLVDASAPSFE